MHVPTRPALACSLLTRLSPTAGEKASSHDTRKRRG